LHVYNCRAGCDLSRRTMILAERTKACSIWKAGVAAVFGLANKRSIAWGIATKLHEAGAKLAISYQNDAHEVPRRWG